jgi:hypothetical protein
MPVVVLELAPAPPGPLVLEGLGFVSPPAHATSQAAAIAASAKVKDGAPRMGSGYRLLEPESIGSGAGGAPGPRRGVPCSAQGRRRICLWLIAALTMSAVESCSVV